MIPCSNCAAMVSYIKSEVDQERRWCLRLTLVFLIINVFLNQLNLASSMRLSTLRIFVCAVLHAKLAKFRY